jgi:hypothetical protein
MQVSTVGFTCRLHEGFRGGLYKLGTCRIQRWVFHVGFLKGLGVGVHEGSGRGGFSGRVQVGISSLLGLD